MDNIAKLAFAMGIAAVVIGWTASDLAGLVHLAAESRRVHSSKAAKPAIVEVTLPRAKDGHFYAEADINGTSVQMLADTGASYVVLGTNVAEEVGLSPDSLDYDRTVQTANGVTKVAFVELSELRVGSIVRRDVNAVVAPGFHGALLGMSFFNTLSKVSIESEQLVLED
ncbi:MAG: TIGR02281 family clan AA aspartic protease [Micropepsaceae bacterium]